MGRWHSKAPFKATGTGMGLFDKLFGPPSKNKFAQLLSDAIRQAGETVAIRYDAGEFRLVVEGEEQRFFNLANIYREYCTAPASQRPGALRLYVRSWFANRKSIPDSFEDVGPDLLPAVRNRCYFESTQLKAQLDGLSIDWPYRVVAEHLAVSLVYDLPEAMMQVQQHHLADWGRGFEEAFNAACENLSQISQDHWESPFPGVWVSPWRDNHDATRLVLADLIQSRRVKGNHVAMAPNRDMLIVAGSEDEPGLARMAILAEKNLDHPRMITGLAFTFDNETWEPWLPDTEHPLYDQFNLLQLKSFGRDYAEQKDVLDALHQKTGKNVWVASFSAVRNEETRRAHSYCVWSQGLNSLLPKADQVYFFVPKGEKDGSVVARADWDRVQRLVGDLMAPQEIYPERYLVEEFPTAEQLAAIGRD